MARQQLRALVVDDEPAARWLTAQALRKLSFDCQEAADGQDALTCLSRQSFDLLVTDLRMPKLHGHSLIVEVLSRPGQRPAVVVLTGVAEPRLVEDLLLRGVDGVEFKPIDFTLFAAKVRAICDRRRAVAAAPAEVASPPAKEPDEAKPCHEEALSPLTASILESRLAECESVIAISPAAIELGKVIAGGSVNERRLAATVAPDRELTGELLRLANSALFNDARRDITSLRDAAQRLGVRRFAAFAQTLAVFNALQPKVPAWIDRNLVWQRCLASTLAVDLLCRNSGIDFDHSCLPLLSLICPARRMALAALFAERYESFESIVNERHTPLRSLENSVFPGSSSEFLGKLLSLSGVSLEAGELLVQLDASGHDGHMRYTAGRQIAELLDCGELLGRLAVGRWEMWDTLDAVSNSAVKAFEIRDPQAMVERVRSDLKLLLKPAKDDLHVPALSGRPHLAEVSERVLFFHPEFQQRDLIAVLLRSLGMDLVPLSLAEATGASLLVVSGSGVDDATLAELLDLASRCRERMRMMFLVDAGKGQRFEPLGTCVELPCGIGALCHAVREFVRS